MTRTTTVALSIGATIIGTLAMLVWVGFALAVIGGIADVTRALTDKPAEKDLYPPGDFYCALRIDSGEYDTFAECVDHWRIQRKTY